MRNLRKNQRPLWFASYLESRPIVDEWGNETLDAESIYSNPQEISLNYSSNTGEEATRVFGDISQYSRIICFTGPTCPLKEKDKLWIGIPTTSKANYEVSRVADSRNSWLIGCREIV